MKGIELPVNVLVIVAIAVLVMLGMTALYLSGIISWNPVAQYMAQNAACGALKAEAEPCSAKTSTIGINWDTDVSGTIDDLDKLNLYCKNVKGCTATNYDLPKGFTGSVTVEELCCKAIVCGCPGYERPTRK